MERAQASQILRIGDDGTYRFAHDLYRQCVADSLSPARRALVHGRLARNLAAAGGPAARIARHFELAQLDREAAPWFVRAGIDAARVFDLETALQHYGHALQLGLEAGEAYTVHDRRLLLLHRLHRTEEQLHELALMATLARATDNPAAPYDLAAKRAVTLINSGRVADGLVQARWIAAGAPTPVLVVRAHYMAGVALMYLGDGDAAVHELEAALVQAPTILPAWEPMICAFLCHLAVSAGALDVASRHFERGLQAADALAQPLARADVLNAGCRIAEAAGDRPLAIERLQEANALSVGVGDVTLRINYLFNLTVVLLNGGDAPAAHARQAEVLVLLAGKSDPKSGFVETLLAGRIALHDGELGRAWHSLRDAFDAAASASDISMQRSALIARAHLAADCGQVGLLEELLIALADVGPHPPQRAMLVEEALRARLELIAGDAAAAAARLRAAFAGPAPRCPDPDWQENTELAQVTLALALAESGEAEAAGAALRGVRFSPRLQAMATEAALRIAPLQDDGRYGAPADAIGMARALLAEGRLAPLEAVRLSRALAACCGRLGHTQGAADARTACQRLIDTLVATLPEDEPSTARLRTALNSLRPA
jgi:tetratricopeptide (TPR) repeat protein